MMGPFGARGEVQITRESDMTRRVISIRTAKSMALILNAITLCAYLVIWLFWWWILIRVYEPRLGASPLTRWWECVQFVATEWGAVMSHTWPLWVIPLPLEWPTPLLILYLRNLYPKLLNENWPPPWSQVAPLESGFVTAHNMDDRSSFTVPVPELAKGRETLHVIIEDLTQDTGPIREMCDLFSPAGHPGNLARYAAALIRDNGTRAAFSYAGGKHVNGAQFYGYTPNEFDELEPEVVRAGLVSRVRKNQPYQVTPRGEFTFARIAARGLGQASLSPTPAA
jgi:hypothetical protein